jgi:hypothetical protein
MFQNRCARAAQVGLFVFSLLILASTLGVSRNARAQSVVAPSFKCTDARWSQSSASAGAFSVSADITGDSPMRTFANGSSFIIKMNVAAPSTDELEWQVTGYAGQSVTSGILPVRGTGTFSVACTSTLAGYFSLGAAFHGALKALPHVGSRPAGIATFGVLPDVASPFPAAGSLPLEKRRFGLQGADFVQSGVCCDGNGLQPLNRDLGSSWVLDSRSELNMEPNSAGQYNPATQPLDVGFENGQLGRIVTLNGIPAWASTAPSARATGSYPPRSFSAFRAYTALVGEESARVQSTYIPNQQYNYYQVTWEPDPGTPTAWMGTDAQFVQLYQSAWNGVHATDSNAKVMGPTTTSLTLCSDWLNRLAPLGLTKYLDAVSCHGYYAIAASSAIPPEPAGLANQMRTLRQTMTNLLPAGTKLFITETGIAYPMGSVYSASYPTSDVLAQHAQAVVRTHLMLLGEGADTSFLFYSADYSGQVGYGLYFNLAMPNPDFGSPDISPKPAAMAIAAAARLVDGTKSLGAVTNLPGNCYGYSFLLSDGVHVVTALWTHDSSFEAKAHHALTVDLPGSSGTVLVFDAMGNPSARAYTDGALMVRLTEMPTYVLSSNAGVMKRQLRAPEGYE